ncbi:hypothetical protein [Candidatus Nitrospira allomarina]|uniref:Uncharacterized protein n=1 Tax=Candidatus Nitrospira allomarina TaxID=3020900 RepID=A0AA96G9L4_9BACT|nr:hypothetical protein [Candidatus Nitrospira allomarina]WNM57332.1 hypothetical protein PP769_15340 [Candidatus Nitrospira allomarina]
MGFIRKWENRRKDRKDKEAAVQLLSGALAWGVFSFLSFRGFAPGRRGFAWCVSKSATFVVEAKVAKTIDAPSGLIAEEGRELFEERPNSPGSDTGR